ncbi:MAG: hypothetical protein ACTHKT_14185 [Solirubrobacterales bacterium]
MSITFRLARAIVRVAGAVHPPQAREWSADIAFLQQPPAEHSGPFLLAPAAFASRLANYFAGDPQHVSFVRESDGSLRGIAIAGAEDFAVAASPGCLERLQDCLEASGQSVTVLVDDELETLLALGERAAPHFPSFRGEEEEGLAEIAYGWGTPPLSPGQED